MTVRRRLARGPRADPDLQVVGEAADGKAAIELCQTLRPDVVTLDMMLPVMSGLAATEYIMAYCPTPILIVSSSTNRGELFKTYEALAAGAVDVLEKPQADDPPGDWEAQLISAIKIVSRIRVITHVRGKLPRRWSGAAGHTAPVHAERPRIDRYRLIAIGLDRGAWGVWRMLRALPPDFPVPILLVIHIGEPFGGASPTGSTGRRRCASAREDGERCLRWDDPACYWRTGPAPGARHGRLPLLDAPERHSCRPSVDVLFESVAREIGDRTIGCLLTGMGKDGAAGLLDIRPRRRFGRWPRTRSRRSCSACRRRRSASAPPSTCCRSTSSRPPWPLWPAGCRGVDMKPRILVVDDSLTVRMDLLDAFESAGLTANVCGSVAEARAALARHTHARWSRNYFEDCIFAQWSSSAQAAVFYVAAASPAGIDRWQIVKNCIFYNDPKLPGDLASRSRQGSGGAERLFPAQELHLGRIHRGGIRFHFRACVLIDGGAPASNATISQTGIAVAPTA